MQSACTLGNTIILICVILELGIGIGIGVEAQLLISLTGESKYFEKMEALCVKF